jgi:cytochrome c-type biogenesis protein CcmE
MRPRRLRWIVCGAVCFAAVAWLLGAALSANVQYFRTTSEAVAQRAHDGNDMFRLAGAVVPGSITRTDHGVNFVVTDGRESISVVHRGDPPELFKDGAPVVCEGRWAAAGGAFASERILIKHGAEYTPPTTAAVSS